MLATDVPVVEPGDLAEARAAVTETTGPLLFAGARTKLDWGAPPEHVDRVVSTARLASLESHDPGDMTAVVEAGMPLEALQQALGAHGQWLAVDPPHPGATIGGTLATDDHGPRRLRYGTLRDLVIGATTVLADGAVSRTGGRVIKNVAGFDLAKLWCGSLGTLGLVVQVVVRVHPLPGCSGTLRVPVDDVDAATGLMLALRAGPAEPSALDWDGTALLVRIEGRTEAVTAQRDALAAVARSMDTTGEDWLEGSDEAAVWDAAAEALRGAEGETTVRAATLPTRLPAAVAALREVAGKAGVDVRVHSHAALGLHTARLAGGSPQDHAATVDGWRQRLSALGGNAVVRRRLPGLEDADTIWGPQPPSTSLMQRVKAELDPQRRCAPGRFVGGI